MNQPEFFLNFASNDIIERELRSSFTARIAYN